MKYSDDEYRNETLRVPAACDWASGVKLAREEGVAEGFVKSFVTICTKCNMSEEEGMLLAAKELLLQGINVSIIAGATGLDEGTIKKLRTELLN